MTWPGHRSRQKGILAHEVVTHIHYHQISYDKATEVHKTRSGYSKLKAEEIGSRVENKNGWAKTQSVRTIIQPILREHPNRFNIDWLEAVTLGINMAGTNHHRRGHGDMHFPKHVGCIQKNLYQAKMPPAIALTPPLSIFTVPHIARVAFYMYMYLAGFRPI